MSYEATIAVAVETALAAGLTADRAMAPLIDQIGRITVLGARGARGARDGMIEIIRNDLDEAVARHSTKG